MVVHDQLSLGGAGSQDITELLRSLLTERGVPDDQAKDRAVLVIDKLG